MLDAKAKPVLFASCCKDSVIRLYELPSFKLRARLFSRKEVEAVQIGPDGLFFLGDRSGSVVFGSGCCWQSNRKWTLSDSYMYIQSTKNLYKHM